MVGGIDLAKALHKEIVNTKESSEFETYFERFKLR